MNLDEITKRIAELMKDELLSAKFTLESKIESLNRQLDSARGGGFLSGFAEGARHERNLEELKRRLADGPDVSVMTPKEYALHVANLQDEIDPPMDGEISYVEKLRERLDSIGLMLSQRERKPVTDDDVISFSSHNPTDATPKPKKYLHTIKTQGGDVIRHVAEKHSVWPLGEDFFKSLSLFESILDREPFVKFTEECDWTCEEIQGPNETEP